ncbi:MAG: type II toxin-antitoxin system RelE/ParE family toxin [Desulfobacteraceae bacterium]|nr:type II toxin-antitoxin system RelE/ParE family toxin [Desulfobacteraceae bacterium]
MKRYGGSVSFSLLYHPDVEKRDLPKLNNDMRKRVKRAIETRLLAAPQEYGEPLRKTLKNYRKLRVGDYRIVFRVEDTEILVLGICHRREAYSLMEKRSQKPLSIS